MTSDLKRTKPIGLMNAEPMENFGELGDLIGAVVGGPEQTPAWVKDFDTQPIGITVKFKAKPGQRSNFVKVMKTNQGTTIEEEGVAAVPHFKLHTSPFDDHVFYLVEEWASLKALKKHFTSDYMKPIGAALGDMLVPNSEGGTYVALYNIGFHTVSNPQVAVAAGERGLQEPMENFGDIGDFIGVVMAAPEQTPEWLKEFDTKPIGITVKFKAKPDQRDNFVKVMKKNQKLTIQQEGVVAVPHFKLHTSPFDDHVFYLVEEWASLKALRKHFASDYMKEIGGSLDDILVPSSECGTYVALYDIGFEEK